MTDSSMKQLVPKDVKEQMCEFKLDIEPPSRVYIQNFLGASLKLEIPSIVRTEAPELLFKGAGACFNSNSSED
jgi:hypothetical protein